MKLKVAPYLMIKNQEVSIDLWAYDGGMSNQQFRNDLGVSGQLVTYDTDSQWAQDAVDIGYTEAPHARMWVAAHARHQGDDNGDVSWARDKLLDHVTGLYRRPIAAIGNSRDFGGNLELMPPTAAHPPGAKGPP